MEVCGGQLYRSLEGEDFYTDFKKVLDVSHERRLEGVAEEARSRGGSDNRVCWMIWSQGPQQVLLASEGEAGVE